MDLITYLITCYNVVHGRVSIPFNSFLFSTYCGTRGHYLKLFYPDRDHYFSIRVISLWNRLSASINRLRTFKCSTTYFIVLFFSVLDVWLSLCSWCLLHCRSTVAPEISLPNQRMGQSLGRETILLCSITAYPQAVSYWEKNGRTISSSNKHRIEAYKDDHALTLSLRWRHGLQPFVNITALVLFSLFSAECCNTERNLKILITEATVRPGARGILWIYFFSNKVINRWNDLDQSAISAFKKSLEKVGNNRMGFFMD